ncbi:MAG: hypothetical protein ACD_58C00021G0003 [uncultured bacterium]|nr:MAG: hypothetical protein ACD_58C00021G0003 [uncultured bacterium]
MTEGFRGDLTSQESGLIPKSETKISGEIKRKLFSKSFFNHWNNKHEQVQIESRVNSPFKLFYFTPSVGTARHASERSFNTYEEALQFANNIIHNAQNKATIEGNDGRFQVAYAKTDNSAGAKKGGRPELRIFDNESDAEKYKKELEESSFDAGTK